VAELLKDARKLKTKEYSSKNCVLFFSPKKSSSGNANIVELNIKIEIKPSAVDNNPIPWATFYRQKIDKFLRISM
jgi:hypothetical protein